MKYYKIISRHTIQEYTKPYVYIEGLQISNPSGDVLAMAGIKPLTVDLEPEYDMETQYLESYYEEGEEYITRKWEVFDIPDEEVINDESTDA